jgi:large subunit ribosomal protein L18
VKQYKRLNKQRRTRAFRVSNAVKRNSTRPRLCVKRSIKHILAQVIDDDQGRTIVSASTQDKDLREQIAYGGNCDAAEKVGKAIAEKAAAAGVKKLAFDRRQYKYHGRVRTLANAVRDAGIDLGAKGDPSPKKGTKGSKGKKGEKAQGKGGKAKGGKKGGGKKK